SIDYCSASRKTRQRARHRDVDISSLITISEFNDLRLIGVCYIGIENGLISDSALGRASRETVIRLTNSNFITPSPQSKHSVNAAFVGLRKSSSRKRQMVWLGRRDIDNAMFNYRVLI